KGSDRRAEYVRNGGVGRTLGLSDQSADDFWVIKANGLREKRYGAFARVVEGPARDEALSIGPGEQDNQKCPYLTSIGVERCNIAKHLNTPQGRPYGRARQRALPPKQPPHAIRSDQRFADHPVGRTARGEPPRGRHSWSSNRAGNRREIF